MSVASEITRLQNAKASLKTSINAKTDAQHQIDDETIDNYANFVDSITTGGGHDWTAIGYICEPAYITNGYNYAVQIYNNYDTSITDWYSLFASDLQLVFMPLVNSSNAVNCERAFSGCKCLQKVPALNFSSATNMNYMFNMCGALREIDFTNFNTANVTTMARMFFRCFGIITMTMPFNTSQVADMQHMFEDCWNITTLDLSTWTSASSVNCNTMFFNCRSLTRLDMRSFDFTKISNYTSMFGNNASYGPPNDCLIIVKNSTQRNWFSQKFSRFTNVKLPSEL